MLGSQGTPESLHSFDLRGYPALHEESPGIEMGKPVRNDSGRTTAGSSPFVLAPSLLGRRAGTIAAVVLLVLLAVVLLRTAWVSDDAYITLRTVDNFVNGYGLRWNVDERVQSFTHPLWFFVVSAAYVVTREPFYTVTVLTLVLSLLTAGLFVRSMRESPWAAALGLAVLVSSRAFVDYSTSGLENALSHLLIVLFASLLDDAPNAPRKLLLLALAGGAIALNRLDLLLLVGPPLGLALVRFRRARGLGLVALGFAPLALWTLFSLLYYGMPYPNTALAKLNTGIDSWQLAAQGGWYLVDSLRTDPVTLPAIAAGFAMAVWTRSAGDIALAGGTALYLAYVVKIGGDFMGGRFLAAPLLFAALLLARGAARRLPSRPAVVAGAAVAALAVGLLAPFPNLTSGRMTGLRADGVIDARGIADERRYYFGATGLFNGAADWSRPVADFIRPGVEARRGKAPLIIEGAVGVRGFYAGPAVHLVDFHGLCDPLLARLPAVARDPDYADFMIRLIHRPPDQPWRIGHFRRALPPGYVTTLLEGGNVIAEPGLAELFDRLRLVTRGPLWSRDRLLAIVQLNLGGYRKLVPTARPEFVPVPWDELIAARPDHAEGYYRRGKQSYETRGPADALADLQHAVALDPQHELATYRLGEALDELRRHDEAIACWRRIIALDPTDPGSRVRLGNSLRAQGHFREAIVEFQRAIELDPRSFGDMASNIGLAWFNAGDADQAVSWLERSVGFDPRAAEHRYNLGFVLLQLGRPQRAIDELEAAVGLDPLMRPAQYDLARAYVQVQDPERAARVLDRLLQRDPRHAEAWFLRGQLHAARGDRAAAGEDWRRAADLGFPPALKLLEGSPGRSAPP